MADSPAKRRKTSPTSSVPIDAPATPSRIPVPIAEQSTTKTSARRPSFASPTKASLARHNPHLLNRPSSSGSGSERPGSRGKNLQDVFAKALGEVAATQSIITGEDRYGTKSMSTTQENDPEVYGSQPQSARGTTPTHTQPIGGGLSTKPRRLSRSPVKSWKTPSTIHGEDPTKNQQENVNPFKKKGLRRSPVPGQAENPAQDNQNSQQENINPFVKTGLRRSPVSSQPVEKEPPQSDAPPYVPPTTSRLRRSPVASNPSEAPIDVFSPKKRLRRSPIASLPNKNIEASLIPLSASRLSRSPVASAQRENIETPVDVFSPKKRLRRSPAASLPSENIEPPLIEGPRLRSPVASLVSENTEPPLIEGPRLRSPVASLASKNVQPPIIETPPDVFTPKKRLRRSPVLSQAAEYVEHLPIEPPQHISTTPTEPVPAPPGTGLFEVVREELAPHPNKSRPSDDVLLTDEVISSLGPPRPLREFGMAELFAANRPERPEPELPPTPTQRGIPDPVVTTPPTGIHDTPSKRTRRNKALSEKLKSSPLKPKDPPPPSPSKEKQPEPQEPKTIKKEPAKRRKSARFLIPEDPYAAKKKARDDLLKELQQLQADVALANQENERLRLRAESKTKGPSTAPNSNDVLNMLTRATAPEQPTELKPKPTSIFKSINAFLPFHPRRKPAPAPLSEKPLPSHLPVPLDDPLPYLQAFSTLNYTSTITVLPSDPMSTEYSTQTEPIMQKHLITASHPSGLFTTRFSMTVDTSAPSISSIDILRLDMNAEKELGTFIRGRARDQGPLGRDITVICWAMSRWTGVSIKRAQFWCTVEQEFGTSEARMKSLQRKKKRKRLGSVNDESSVAAEDKHEKIKWSRKQLLSHFGRSSMELSNEEVELRFEWKIGFDWTGEVESSTVAAARVPKSWQQADERSSLSKVPETFEKLKKEKGPLGAVRAMVGLLMPPL